MNVEYQVAEEGVAIQNISVDPQGRFYPLTQGTLRRWWQTRRGWKHFAGHHFFE